MDITLQAPPSLGADLRRGTGRHPALRRGDRARGPDAAGARARGRVRRRARAAAASPRCSSSCAGCRRPTQGRCAAQPAVYMPQRDLLFPWLNALDNAALPLRVAGASPRRRPRAGPSAVRRARPRRVRRARPEALSGGMRQRVAFLRTLLSGKPVLALDEPFAALDAITRAEVQRGWRRRWRASRAPSCWSPTTSRRRWCSATASWSSPRAPGASWPSCPLGCHARAGAPTPTCVALRERALAALGVPA